MKSASTYTYLICAMTGPIPIRRGRSNYRDAVALFRKFKRTYPDADIRLWATTTGDLIMAHWR